jgi:hypothetical protein
MTKLLEQAVEKLRRLPGDKQECYARLLLQELQTDEAFEASSALHIESLSRLVRDVLADDELSQY